MTSPRRTTTVVLIDDHAVVRAGLVEILRTQPDIEVVGEAGSSASAVNVVEATRPDVVLLDVEIPGDEVTVTIGRIRARSPATRILILSMYEGPDLLRRLLAAGISGYLLKSVEWQDLVAAIRTVGGERGRIVLEVSASSLHAPPVSAVVLTPRERQVLELTAAALSNSQIASQLALTEATVKRHLRSVFAKLGGAVSRLDAVNRAVAASLITIERPGAAGLRRFTTRPD